MMSTANSALVVQQHEMDLEFLLAPCAGKSPAGTDLGSTDIYQQIEHFRTAVEPEGILGTLKEGQARVADWKKVYSLAGAAMATQSKDLRLAFYVAESLAHQNGLSGIQDGFRLVEQLHQRFWTTMYPRLAADDLEARTVWLERLDRAFQQIILRLPITQVNEGKNFEFWHWRGWQIHLEQARAVGNPDEKKKAIAAASYEKECLDQVIAKTALSFYDELYRQVALCFEACDRCCAAVQKALETETASKQLEEWPTFFFTRKELTGFRTLIEQLSSAKMPAVSVNAGCAAETCVPGQPRTAATSVVIGEPLTRMDAINQLTLIAAFFQRTEPHSPIGCLIERAIRWSRLSLTQLLEEILHDAGALAKIKDSLGILPH